MSKKTEQKRIKEYVKLAYDVRKILSANLIYVSLYTFSFFVMIGLYINTYTSPHSENPKVVATTNGHTVLAAHDQKVYIVPTLHVKSDLTLPILSAQSALVVDLDSGITMFEKNPDSPMLPASTVKIMTAIIAMETMPEEKIVTVGNKYVDGQKMNLFPGEQMTVGNLLEGMLVYSANDAAEALADSFTGGRDAFVAAMNQKVQDLGLTNTKYNNPTGFDGFDQVTTARDLKTIAEYAMTNPRFSQIVSMSHVDINDVSGQFTHSLDSTNKLLGVVDGVKGIKTGWTENARENLVTYVDRDGNKVIITLLGSQDRFGETKELIDWIYSNYEWKEVLVNNIK